MNLFEMTFQLFLETEGAFAARYVAGKYVWAIVIIKLVLLQEVVILKSLIAHIASLTYLTLV